MNMKKVGILSMQRIANYGSFLQSYGLKKILEEIGCDVEFVDYHIGEPLVKNGEKVGARRKLLKASEVFKGAGTLSQKFQFLKYKKNYAKKYYPKLGINENYNYNPRLDVLVIGSDEVFNCVQDNANVGFSPELFGADNNADRVITYAASFGNTTLKKLEDYNIKEKVAGWLNDIDAVSVRDVNSGKIVENLCGKDISCNLDPVLIYDFIGKCKNIPQKIDDKRYMLLYGYSGRFSKDECEKIRGFAKKRGLKIFCIGGIQDACDKFIDCDPFSVISYFKNAECIVTDTYHGTIFSVITQRPFVSVIRKSGYGNFEKLSDLLCRIGLDERILSDINELERKIDKKPDYISVFNVIEQEREKSYSYLKKQIFQADSN